MAVALLVVSLVLAAGAREVAAVPVNVTVQTAGLQVPLGMQPAVDFILEDHDGAFGNNTATISGFTGATLAPGASTLGNVSGTLANTVTLTDSAPLGIAELIQPVSLGSSLGFTLDLSSNVAGGGPPDLFRFAILGLDESNTTALLDASFQPRAFDLPVGSTTPSFISAGVSISQAGPGPDPGPGPIPDPIPEPATIMLMVAGVPVIGVAIHRRRRRSR